MYGDWYGGIENDGIYSQDVELQIPEAVQNNGSFYMHAYLVQTGDSPDPNSGTYNERYTIHRTRQMNKFRKRRYSKTHNLLTGETEATEEEVLVRKINQAKLNWSQSIIQFFPLNRKLKRSKKKFSLTGIRT